MRATPPRRDRTRWRIGLLDSNPRSRVDVRRLIEPAVATVVIDSPPRPESVALLRSLEPDAVLLSAEDAVRSGDGLRAALSRDLPAPVVLVSGPGTLGTLTPCRIVGVMAVLLRPLRAEEVRPTVEIAIARLRDLRRLRRVLADRPVVEAAKARLMARDGLSEAAAFGWLRRRAMEQQMRMGEVARTVLGGEGRTTWHAGS